MTAFTAGAAVSLVDRDYLDFVLASVEQAHRRVWASLFLYDPRPSRDLAGHVMELTMALAERRAIGVDVRVLVGAEVSTLDIAVANRSAALLLEQYGVSTRHAFGEAADQRRGSHAKFAVIDQLAVVGSQNWTDDAFRLNIEDAVVLSGTAVELLGAQFQAQWNRGRRLRDDSAD